MQYGIASISVGRVDCMAMVSMGIRVWLDLRHAAETC